MNGLTRRPVLQESLVKHSRSVSLAKKKKINRQLGTKKNVRRTVPKNEDEGIRHGAGAVKQ